MKKWLVLFIVIVLGLAFAFYNNSNIENIISGLDKKGSIEPGELRYRIYLLGIFPVGEAIFRIEKAEEYNGKKVFHLSASAGSLKSFSKLFSGQAVLDSYVDMQGLSPVLFKQKVIISGKQNIERSVIYDQKNGVMDIAGLKRQIYPNTQDPLSAMFSLKHMDFDKIKEFQMSINTNQKNYILKGIVSQQELSINKKTYKIVLAKAKISRRDKNPYHQSSLSIVLLNKEKENIPILIKVFASGFLINAKLIEIK